MNFYQPQPTWGPGLCDDYAYWLNCKLELQAIKPHCRPCKDPDGRDGLVVEWTMYGRQVELYQSFDGHWRVLRRDGAPVADVICDARTALDELRTAVAWMENRRSEGGENGMHEA